MSASIHSDSSEKSQAIASYIELKCLKITWLFRVKFKGQEWTKGYFFPVRAITASRCFPRKIWWFIEINELRRNNEVLSLKVHVDEIEEIDYIN